MEAARWEHFPHDADVGIRGLGPTLESAFEQAAVALKEVITSADVVPGMKVDVSCEAPDHELLLIDWLNAIIYEMAVRRMLFSRFEAHITGNRLTASLWGEPVDRAKHTPACEPKGATYTALRVAQSENGEWSAACVVDV